jgi:hypothetical protein
VHGGGLWAAASNSRFLTPLGKRGIRNDTFISLYTYDNNVHSLTLSRLDNKALNIYNLLRADDRKDAGETRRDEQLAVLNGSSLRLGRRARSDE